MAIWSKRLYVGENAAKAERRIREAVDKGLFYPDAYLITFSANENEQLDIVKTTQLLYFGIARRLPPIVGIAVSKGEAVRLVLAMASDIYAETKDVDFRAYFADTVQ